MSVYSICWRQVHLIKGSVGNAAHLTQPAVHVVAPHLTPTSRRDTRWQSRHEPGSGGSS